MTIWQVWTLVDGYFKLWQESFEHWDPDQRWDGHHAHFQIYLHWLAKIFFWYQVSMLLLFLICWCNTDNIFFHTSKFWCSCRRYFFGQEGCYVSRHPSLKPETICVPSPCSHNHWGYIEWLNYSRYVHFFYHFKSIWPYTPVDGPSHCCPILSVLWGRSLRYGCSTVGHRKPPVKFTVNSPNQYGLHIHTSSMQQSVGWQPVPFMKDTNSVAIHADNCLGYPNIDKWPCSVCEVLPHTVKFWEFVQQATNALEFTKWDYLIAHSEHCR